MAKTLCLSKRSNDVDSRSRRQRGAVAWGPRTRCIGSYACTSRFVALLLLLLVAGAAGARNPLQSEDTSSPRATMESFFALTEEAARRYYEFRDSPSPATQDALWQISDKATGLFDLSQVPPAARRKVADETFYLIWEIIGRVELPDLADIPDASPGKKGDEPAKVLSSWQIPRTEITIARVEEGPRAGKFLFSPDTVRRAPYFYELARHLPYVRPMLIENVYAINQSFTGWMIPLAWVEALPDWANTLVLGQLLWKWLALLLLLGLAPAAVVLVYLWARRRSWDGSLRSYLRYLSTPVAILVLAALLWWFALAQINVTGSAVEVPDYVLAVAKGIAVVWLVWLTASWIAEAIIASPRIGPRSLNANLIRLAARSVGFLAVFVLLFRVAHDLGVPVYGLVAGAGVGGLAIALAARSTLENFLGTLNLYADRPVRVGDFCRYGEDPSPGWLRIGTVEEIGLRSTRLRGIDRTITTIPNGEFSNMHIVNLTKRDRMIFRPTLALRSETTAEQLRLVSARLRELLLAHPRVTDDPARVRFAGFGEYSFNLEIFAYVNTSDWNEFLAIREDLHFRILDIVEEAGTGFAFASRLYHARDGGLDGERQQAAAKQVREWAAAHALPFPDFPADYRKQIMGTLDYPPEGSPEADN